MGITGIDSSIAVGDLTILLFPPEKTPSLYTLHVALSRQG